MCHNPAILSSWKPVIPIKLSRHLHNSNAVFLETVAFHRGPRTCHYHLSFDYLNDVPLSTSFSLVSTVMPALPSVSIAFHGLPSRLLAGPAATAVDIEL
jgi:hypothetical protein